MPHADLILQILRVQVRLLLIWAQRLGLGLLHRAHHVGVRALSHSAVVTGVIPRLAVDPDDLVPVSRLAPGELGVPGRVVELAIKLIDVRLKFSDSPLQSYGFVSRRR